jgi:hypothetical protein
VKLFQVAASKALNKIQQTVSPILPAKKKSGIFRRHGIRLGPSPPSP